MQEQTTFLDTPAAGEYPVPEGARFEHCKSCNAVIVWGKTDKGSAVPLDVQTVKIYAGQRYALTHFATCPHGREWRRHR